MDKQDKYFKSQTDYFTFLLLNEVKRIENCVKNGFYCSVLENLKYLETQLNNYRSEFFNKK